MLHPRFILLALLCVYRNCFFHEVQTTNFKVKYCKNEIGSCDWSQGRVHKDIGVLLHSILHSPFKVLERSRQLTSINCSKDFVFCKFLENVGKTYGVSEESRN